jgi:hypothetical protein
MRYFRTLVSYQVLRSTSRTSGGSTGYSRVDSTPSVGADNIVTEPAKSCCFYSDSNQSTVRVLHIWQSTLSTFKSSTVPTENLTVTSTVQQTKGRQRIKSTMMPDDDGEKKVDCFVSSCSSGNQPVSCTWRLLFTVQPEFVHCLGSKKRFIMVGKRLFDRC